MTTAPESGHEVKRAIYYREYGTTEILGTITTGGERIAPGKRMQLTLWVDLEFCVGCRACTMGCKAENNTLIGQDYNRVLYVEVNKYPRTRRFYVPMPCMHCGKPPCLAACPVGAIIKTASHGIVLIDSDKCIGCRYCIWACPFGAPQFNYEKWITAKCTLCAHKTLEVSDDINTAPITGKKPACVTTCVGRVRFFGEMEKLSMVRRGTRALRVGRGFKGAEPSVLYSFPSELSAE